MGGRPSVPVEEEAAGCHALKTGRGGREAALHPGLGLHFTLGLSLENENGSSFLWDEGVEAMLKRPEE